MSPKFCSLALEEEVSVESYEAELKLVLKEVPIDIGNAPYHAAAEAIVIKGRMTVSF